MLCTQDIIFTLHPVPWDQQVTELLKQKKVSEALELAKYAHKTSLSPEEQRDVSFRDDLALWNSRQWSVRRADTIAIL